MNKKLLYSTIALVAVLSLNIHIQPLFAEETVVRTITFPVIGKVSYGNDFAYQRSDGRTHEGNDIMGSKLLPLVAAVDGTVSYVNYPEATWGYSVGIRDADGYQYRYLHMNNDSPGTDNGGGGGFYAYAPDVVRGAKVVKGQLLGWMGDSGNAESTGAHLHFEIRTPDGTPISPYESLKKATKITTAASSYPQLEGELLPYGSFTGGASIAVGNFDSDQTPEIVTGAKAGGGPHVRIFNKDGIVLNSFFAFDPGFLGGVDVAAADIDGDGIDEIIAAAGPGGGPHVKIFKTNGTVAGDFFAYGTGFRGGVNVSAADTDGDGKAEIITAPASGGGPHVRVMKIDGTVVSEFFAYAATFTKGIDVAATTYGNNQTVIVTTPNSGTPQVKVYRKDGSLISEFLAYDAGFTGGVRVAANKSVANQLQITTVPISGGGPHVRVFNESGVEQKAALAGFEPWWLGGYDISARGDVWYISSRGGRRTSVREIFTPDRSNNNTLLNNRMRDDN